MDAFLKAAIDEARQGRQEGGIPIGSVLVHHGRIIGRGHNRRVQKGSAILHGEMDALEDAGRQPASVYRESVLYTTLSPCSMCSGAILLYGIPRVIVGENKTFLGEEDLLCSRGVAVEVLPGLHSDDGGVHRGRAADLERRHRRSEWSRTGRGVMTGVSCCLALSAHNGNTARGGGGGTTPCRRPAMRDPLYRPRGWLQLPWPESPRRVRCGSFLHLRCFEGRSDPASPASSDRARFRPE